MSRFCQMCIGIFVVAVTIVYETAAQDRQCGVNLSRRVSCGGGTSEQCSNRGCCFDDNVPADGIPHCYFPDKEVPTYSPWSQWGGCSRNCGPGGIKTRERACAYPDGREAPASLCISGPKSEEESCNTQACANTPAPSPSAVTISTTAAPDCTDALPSCATLAALCGSSGSLGNSLKRFCKKTCAICDGGNVTNSTITTTTTTVSTTPAPPPTKYPLTQCIDEYDTCKERVSDICNDTSFVKDLTTYCRKTCNLCTKPSCGDVSPERCAIVSYLCDQPNVQESCPKTCGTCPEADETDSSITTSSSAPFPQTAVQAFSTEVVTRLLTTTTLPPTTTTTTTTLPPTTTTRPTTTATTIPLTTRSSAVLSTDCQDDLEFCANVDGVCSDPVYRSIRSQCKLTCRDCTVNTISAAVDQENDEDACADEANYCDAIKSVCGDERYAHMTINCKKSCNMCNSTTTTQMISVNTFSTSSTATPVTSTSLSAIISTTTVAALDVDEECKDNNLNCPEIVEFCNDPNYQETLATTCKLSCGICTTESVISGRSINLSTTSASTTYTNESTPSTFEATSTAEATTSTTESTTITTEASTAETRTSLTEAAVITATTVNEEDSADNSETSTTTRPAVTDPTTTLSENVESQNNTSSRDLGECVDRFSICSKWLDSPLCESLTALKVNCPATCKSCVNGKNNFMIRTTASTTTTTTTTAATTTTTRDPSICIDEFPNTCSRFVGDIRCETVPELRNDCRRSCGLCT